MPCYQGQFFTKYTCVCVRERGGGYATIIMHLIFIQFNYFLLIFARYHSAIDIN